MNNLDFSRFGNGIRDDMITAGELSSSKPVWIVVWKLSRSGDKSKTFSCWCLHKGWCTQGKQREGLHLAWKSLSRKAIAIKHVAHSQCFQLTEVALNQQLPISKEVLVCIMHSVLRLRIYRAGHAAFRITPTDAILFLPILWIIYIATVLLSTACSRWAASQLYRSRCTPSRAKWGR